HHRSLIDAMPNDPKDRHVLAAAVACKAQIIVTQNLRHFKPEHLVQFEVDALSPDEFLVHLFHLTPERMVEIIKEQAKDLHHPPITLSDLLNILAPQVPMFVKLFRANYFKRL